ncbi:MAG: 1-acyl-sn-glycerol-3-phosphate acyltransferase [Clostridia bacterium]|nr:1-acyl-sn-glycerol-3-phosphate acyltransferase [Clostridia bacterium]
MSKAFKKFGKFIIGNLYRVKEYNKPDLSNGSYILCPNHVSDADGPVMWTHNDNIRILAKKECFQNKLMAKFLTSLDVVKIDRDRHNGVELLEALDYFKDGEKKLFMLFPQGTISDINKNKLTRIKSGAFFIAAKAGVPIIPVFLEQPRPFKRTRVVYGEPMDLSEANADKKVNKEELVKYRIQWQQEIFKLQEMAVKFENRPIRKLKLKPKHQNNNE